MGRGCEEPRGHSAEDLAGVAARMGVWGTGAGSHCKCSLPGAHSERKQEAEPVDHPQARNSRPRGLVEDKTRRKWSKCQTSPWMSGWSPQVDARSSHTDGGGDRPGWPGASSRQRPPREGRVDAPSSAFKI